MEPYVSDTPELDGIVKKYIKGLKKFYPGLKFSSSSGLNAQAYELELALNDNTIKGTEYELQGTNLIHYTSSMQNVIEILHSGFLRMKNMIALNDPQEISFVINYLGLESFKAYIERFKTTYFSASFCKVEIYEQPDEFPMWRLYGGDGSGCAIVFEIEKHDSYWAEFMIAQVQYGNKESMQKFADFMQFHDSFKQIHNFPMNVPLVFPAFMALHKNEIWNYEKEIRLITHKSYDEYTLESDFTICSLKHSIDQHNKKYSYVELPLKGGDKYNDFVNKGNTNVINRYIPILKIKKIVLGYRTDPKIISDLMNIIDFISSNVYGYNIDVEVSHLAKYMS